jgi:hypothetical protein
VLSVFRRLDRRLVGVSVLEASLAVELHAGMEVGWLPLDRRSGECRLVPCLTKSVHRSPVREAGIEILERVARREGLPPHGPTGSTVGVPSRQDPLQDLTISTGNHFARRGTSSFLGPHGNR